MGMALPRYGDVKSFWVACQARDHACWDTRRAPSGRTSPPLDILTASYADRRTTESPQAVLTAAFAPTLTGALLSRQQRDRESPLFAFLKHVGRFSSIEICCTQQFCSTARSCSQNDLVPQYNIVYGLFSFNDTIPCTTRSRPRHDFVSQYNIVHATISFNDTISYTTRSRSIIRYRARNALVHNSVVQ
jgi:hypothetical protein